MAGSSTENASHHLPLFITPPGETDVLFVVVTIFILLLILIVGVLYFKLHSLPEDMAHKANSAQLQIIGILSLLALFTHNNLFWVAALLLAAIKIPDYLSPLESIARSLLKLSKRPELLEQTSTTKVAQPDDVEPPKPKEAKVAQTNTEEPKIIDKSGSVLAGKGES